MLHNDDTSMSVLSLRREIDGEANEAERTGIFTSGIVSTGDGRKMALFFTAANMLAFVPMAMTPTYCATKAAIHSYSQALRYQLKDTTVQVLELIPPYVQIELMGSYQAKDPNAMPLKDFVAEVMNILKTSPDATEICVERVKRLRFAEAGGGYAEFFKQFNDSVSVGRER